MRRAVVVFTHRGSSMFDWALHPQFRHCFVVVQDDKGPWILVDTAGGVPTMSIIGLGDFDVVNFYQKMGLTAVEVERPCESPRWPLTLTTCVGTVKAVLGLRAPLVLTPYALYRRLTDG